MLQQTLGTAYTIERELGGGGMSRVYLAQETALSRTVVIKVIAPELAEGLSAERFAREVKLAARLQQANIVPVLSAGTAGGLPYYTMPYVKGESLRVRLPGPGGPGLSGPALDGLSILRDVARALAYAHGEGVVHRDIKPENILLSGGTAVVSDFGIAKALSESRTAEGAASATLTQAGNSIGTPAYMAPEQAAGAVVDQRADIYAWGVVAYELLSGKHPFAERVGAQQMIAAHITETPKPLPASVAPDLAALVLQALAKNPEQRPANADDLVRRLSIIATTSGERVAPAAKTKSPVMVIAGAAVVALAIAAAWFYTHTPHTDTAQSIVVLPFENLGAAEDAYFAEGMSDEIASQLARIPGMIVVARNSIQRFKGSDRSPQDIATELGATYALSGTVRWARSGTGANGNTEVRIVPALVRSSSGEQVWGEPYQQKLTDVFQVQSDVAERVALALSVTVRKPQQAALRQSESRNPEARDAQMLGRSLLKQRGLGNLRRAVVEFRRAIELDSGYAKAWAGYSAAYLLLPVYFDSTISMLQGSAEAERAARHAIALDSTLPEAQSALATALYQKLQFREALATVDRALALDPSASLVYKDKFEILMSMGRVAEAEAPLRRAIELDPLVPVLLADLSVWFTAIGQPDSAIALSDRVIAMDPGNVFWQFNRLGSVAIAGRLTDAIDACVRLVADQDYCRSAWNGFLEPSRRAEGLAMISRIRRTPALGRMAPPVFLAGVYAHLGEPDSAFAMLQAGLRPGQYELFAFINVPWFNSIKSDPRWDQIVGTVQRQ